MQTIKTKYLKPTGQAGSRISVLINGSLKILPYQYQYNPKENHVRAAMKAAQLLGKNPGFEYDIHKAFKRDDFTKSSQTSYSIEF